MGLTTQHETITEGAGHSEYVYGMDPVGPTTLYTEETFPVVGAVHEGITTSPWLTEIWNRARFSNFLYLLPITLAPVLRLWPPSHRS